MRFFYLEDIRKSYHFLQFIHFDENKSSNELFIYNPKIRDSDQYLMCLKQAFPEHRFVSIDEFQLKELKGSELFLNHTFYSKEGVEFIQSLNCSKITMFLGNNVGLVEHDKSALLISPDEYILWNEAFIFHLLEHRQSKLLNEKHKFRVINFITSKILFQHEKINVLVFAPTRLCFEKEHDITIFLLNLNLALGEIEKSSNVYFKPHQGIINNYLESSKKIYQCISAVMSFLSFRQLQRFARLFEKRKVAIKLLNYSLFKKVERKYGFLRLAYPLLPIELYLPLIESRLIGGFSNSLITAAYLDLKIDLLGMKRIPEVVSKRGTQINSAKYLKLNMRFFYSQSEEKYLFSKKNFN